MTHLEWDTCIWCHGKSYMTHTTTFLGRNWRRKEPKPQQVKIFTKWLYEYIRFEKITLLVNMYLYYYFTLNFPWYIWLWLSHHQEHRISKGLYIIYECILSLEGAIHVTLQVQDIVVLNTDCPVQHWSCVCVCINNTRKTLIIMKY